MARFLFVTTPVTGHVVPLIPLARALLGRGHEIDWYTSSRFRSRIEDADARFHPFRRARDIDYHRLNDLFPERAKLEGIAQTKFDMKMIIDVNVEQCEDLRELAESRRPDVVVADSMAFAGHFVAESLGLKLAFINVTNYFVPSRDAAPDGLALRPSSSFVGRLRNRTLNLLVFRILLREVNHHYWNARIAAGLAATREPLFTCPLKSDLFLQSTIPSFEYPRSDFPPQLHFIGALLPDESADPEKAPSWEKLPSERPIVLVTQGTIATRADDLLRPAIRGLAEEDVLVLATTAGMPPEELPSPLPANARLEPFIPFGAVMGRVSVMVTNGGYGGTHYALTHGVPLVVAGTSEDKAEIAARIAWSGVGVNLRTSAPKPEQIRSAVRTVLSDPSYRERAMTLRDEFARYDAPGRGADLIESLL